jgi:sodium/hydrogen exchanger-like protein 6/7
MTIWALKKRSVRFLHETGLALLYGLIVGAIFRYAPKSNTENDTKTEYNASCYVDQSGNGGSISNGSKPNGKLINEVDDIIIVNINQSQFSYKLDGQVDEDGKWQYRFSEELNKITFDPELFFNVLLPPIIFNAGYSMKKRHFFRNIGAITMFAFIGTTLSTFCIAGCAFIALQLSRLADLAPQEMKFNHCLQFGAMISATDPVTVLSIFKDLKVEPNLDAMLFGESVINDAVAIVLSETFSYLIETENSAETSLTTGQLFGYAFLKFFTVFVGSLAIGTAISIITALLFKFVRFDGMATMETALFFLMSWCSFLLAEALGLTGIVSILFCGILQAHYTYNNLSEESQKSTRELLELLNFLAENFLFIYMGISVFSFSHHRWDPFFTIFAFLGIILGRLINIYPISELVNFSRPAEAKIPCNFQHMMMYSGLRGAVAFALALRDTTTESAQLMFSTTLIIVYSTVLLLGGGTTSMLSYLKVPVGCDDNVTNVETQYKNIVWNGWYKFDYYVMKPILTHNGPPLTATCPSFCHPITNCFTSHEAYTNHNDDDNEVILDADELNFGAPEA